MPSLVELAQNKDAVNFQNALSERLQDKVTSVLESTKIEIARSLFEEPSKLKHVSKDPKDGKKAGKDKKPIEPGKKSVKEETLTECSHNWDGDGKCPKCVAAKKK